MANANTPRGLWPVRYRDGRPYNGAATRFYVPASDSTALFLGDPVIVAGSADADGVGTVIRATAAGGAYISGVVVGVEAETRDSLPYRAASTARYVYVATDPDLLFEIQEDAVGGALAAADIGLNADLVAAAGSAITNYSGFQLDTSTKATTNTLQLRTHGFVQRANNEIGANAKVLVSINLHQSRNTTGI